MARQRLSSALTFFWKIILPLAWVAGFVACAVSWFFITPEKLRDPELQSLKLTFLLVSLIGVPTLLWFSAGLKRVTRDGAELLVSNYLREVRVPMREVKHVYQSWAVSPWRVVIEMRSSTEIGSTFVFVPRFRDGLRHRAFVGRHPAVEEIRAMCDAAR